VHANKLNFNAFIGRSGGFRAPGLPPRGAEQISGIPSNENIDLSRDFQDAEKSFPDYPDPG